MVKSRNQTLWISMEEGLILLKIGTCQGNKEMRYM